MIDAYRVLGLSRGASEEDVKNAYRTLAQKYQPDQFDEGPLRDDMKQKMDELNMAFDAVMSELRTGATTASGVNIYAEIRTLIQNGDADGALQRLNSVPNAKDSAEWNFLVGSAYYYKGWVTDATRYFETACRLDSTNREYQEALRNLQTSAQGNMHGNPYAQQGNPYYGQQGNPYRSTAAGCSCCDLCTALICMDMCCGGGCC